MWKLALDFNAVLPKAVMPTALNVVAVVVLISCVAVIMERLVPRRAAPLRHAVLVVALVLMVACPLPMWIAYECGFGAFAVTPVSAPPASSQAIQSPASRDLSDPSLGTSDAERSVAENDFATEAAAESHAATRVATELIGLTGIQLAESRGYSSTFIIVYLFVLVWTLVSLWLALKLLRSVYTVIRLPRHLEPVVASRVIDVARKTLNESAADDGLELFESAHVPSPISVGWWRPAIVLPKGLIELLNDEELASVLVHEASHIARRDTLGVLVQQLAVVAFWWNPLLWFINRRIEILREQICDDHVVIRQGTGIALATAIVRVAEWSQVRNVSLPLAAPLFEASRVLEDRITRLTEEGSNVSVQLCRKSLATLIAFTCVVSPTLVLPMLRSEDTTTLAAPKPKGVAVAPEVRGSGVSARGFTPLHEAARVGSLETAKRLVGDGADVNARVTIAGVLDPYYDFVDDTPVDVAAALGHDELVELLRKHGGRTATELETKRLKHITWGKPVDGLQLGVAPAIEPNMANRWPTYLQAYVRNSGTEPRTFLVSVHTGVAGAPERTSLLASRLTLYKLGGGDLITLFYQGENHLLRRDGNLQSAEPELGALGKDGKSYVTAALSVEDARRRSITLAPNQQIGPVSIRYGDASKWAPPRNKAWPDRKSQYVVVVALDINHPQSAMKLTLETTPNPRLRFNPSRRVKKLKRPF